VGSEAGGVVSAEVLRRAAALMRERAEAAVTGDELRGDHWFADQQLGGTRFEVIVSDEGTIIAEQLRESDAEHIASWHPAAALAVAELFGFMAEVWQENTECRSPVGPDEPCGDCVSCDQRWTQARALAAARAFLGTEE
jgi:hypothetical protein